MTAPGRVVRVERREHQVAGERGVDGDVGRLEVADLADHDHVGVLAHDVPEARRERQPDLRLDVDLVDAAKLVLDRILDGDDLLVGRVDLVEGGVERRGLAGAGRPGDQEHAVGQADDALDRPPVPLLEAEVVERHQDRRPVEDPHDDALAVERGHRRHAEVEPPPLEAHADAAVLGQAPLGDVQLRHDLDARGDRRLEALRRRLGVEEHAVDAVADPEAVLERLDVDVGRVRLDRVLDEEVDQPDHRRVERHVPERGEVLAAGVVSALVVADRLDDLLDRRRARPEVALDRLEDRGLGGHGQADVDPQRPAQLVDDGRVGRIGAGHHEDAVLDGEGTEAVLAHVLGRQPLEERRARRELLAADVGDLEVAGESLPHLLRAREAEPDQRVGQMLAGGLTVCLGPRQLSVREEACPGQPSSEGRGMAGFHGLEPNSLRQFDTLPDRARGGKECFP